MSIYDKISKKIGQQNWQYNIFHDDGNRESDGGGKSCMYLSPPGKGKSTLMVQAEQSVHSVLDDSKKSFLSHLNHGKDISSFIIEPETVIHRIREFDNFNALFPENWILSNPSWVATVKPVHIFVHEKDSPVFYSYHKNSPISPVNMPPIELYSGAEDLMKKLHWHSVNAVLEPQTYRLSPNLIFALRKHKMDEDTTERDEYGNPVEDSAVKQKGAKPRQKIKYKRREVDYTKKIVDPAYFWYDLLDIAYRSNNRKHITFFIDEFHDVAEADCEGDAWKLVSILATKTYPQFRKNNISLHLSTHQLSFVDYRIAKRIEYIIWFRGAKISPNFSMVTLQALFSNLNIGQIITEEANIQFGITTFDKIHHAPPQIYVEGLAGQNRALSDYHVKKLLAVQEGLQPPDYFKSKSLVAVPEVFEI